MMTATPAMTFPSEASDALMFGIVVGFVLGLIVGWIIGDNAGLGDE